MQKLEFPSLDTSFGNVWDAVNHNVKAHRSIVRNACIDANPKVDQQKLDSVIQNACDWMFANYGYVDWDRYQAEVGDVVSNVLSYCEKDIL